MNSHAVSLQSVSHRYGKQISALDNISLSIPQGVTVGLIGPDGVGKSTLLSLIAGIKIIQTGSVNVFGRDMAQKSSRQDLSHRIAFMPQGLGRNLYPTLSVYENIDFHARLFGLNAERRKARITRLLEATGLNPFPDRPAGKLSGGMKQKLSLCCALVHEPDLLILDEPTTGVDPLSRRQFWALVRDLRAEHEGMTIIVATAYIEEAEQFEHLIAMDDGKLLANRPTREVMAAYDTDKLETAYIRMLPPEKQQSSGLPDSTPFTPDPDSPPAIEAHGLTKRFGNFTAVDHVSFRIEKGEIFGFLGSNGCGKSTTMKMLTGLLQASEGSAELLGRPVEAGNILTRMRVGYMSQAFSLYEELSVRQNLKLHAQLYHLKGSDGLNAVENALTQFELTAVADQKPGSLSLGIRQRLQLAAACLHKPEVLILDEPTSGVDPAARDMFWQHLLKLSRQDKITIFVSTHFMNEAERCDRISLMHKGRVLAVGQPQELIRQQQTADLEEAFIQYLLDDESKQTERPSENPYAAIKPPEQPQQEINQITDRPSETPPESERDSAQSDRTDTLRYWFATVWTFALRESKELLRDKIRLFFAIMGPVILMTALSWSISFNVQDLTYTVIDHDQTVESRRLTEYFSGSPYFTEKPLPADTDAEAILKSSYVRLVIDIPEDFGRELIAGNRPEAAFYIDGAMPFNARNIQGYIGSILGDYGQDMARRYGLTLPPPAANIETRFMYNQDFESIFAIAPGVLMLVLMLIPAMMSVVGVVREREIGSISNFYTSPATVPQFLFGKQLPYIAVGMANYVVLLGMMIFWFKVPVKGSFTALTVGTLILLFVSTALGLLASTFARSQVAAISMTAIVIMIPTFNNSGFLNPLSAMEGGAYLMGKLMPASWYLSVSIGTFTKGLGWPALLPDMGILIVFYTVYFTLACFRLKKQEK
ncbi:ribosome-associated ATPase/putative transporter RbbA [Neisseria montereyensis]|uniref:Ribosome-associated ATPase/putative transporter RbbA n=1 Tax=Neisseria montereyensis TaxID=2973938 RepID=A0ABT2FCP5_9NEIS|nr:ribosome-associated ATPase/putative transporter RbbA [Neisseria montereyensis]MCS4533504.1 ribosome-associated ATPase/putative transporter RbbA [Neisseria montereyensis]